MKALIALRASSSIISTDRKAVLKRVASLIFSSAASVKPVKATASSISKVLQSVSPVR